MAKTVQGLDETRQEEELVYTHLYTWMRLTEDSK